MKLRKQLFSIENEVSERPFSVDEYRNCHFQKLFQTNRYDLEQPFGFLGNFFTARLKRGRFVANPPFYGDIMNRFLRHLKRNLDRYKGLEVYITIPMWYIPDRMEYNQRNPTRPLDVSYKNDLRKDILKKYIRSK